MDHKRNIGQEILKAIQEIKEGNGKSIVLDDIDIRIRQEFQVAQRVFTE